MTSRTNSESNNCAQICAFLCQIQCVSSLGCGSEMCVVCGVRPVQKRVADGNRLSRKVWTVFVDTMCEPVEGMFRE